MFKAAVFRLTLWYLLIIMLLSTGFSMALYRVSTRELDANQQQLEILLERSFFSIRRGSDIYQQFNQARLEQIIASRNRIKWNLTYFNLLILLVGGAASYFLARKTLQPIEENVEAQARFTSDASHELRTPLTAMRSEIEVAMRDKHFSFEEAKELLRSNLEEINRLETLSTGLLTLARNDTGATFKDNNVHDLVTEAEKRLSTAAKIRSITIENKTEQETVYGETWSLVELISILLDNAIKYSPNDSTISITSFNRHHAKQVGIVIKDQGEGISELDLPHIFDRFYRADRSRTKDSTTGYGLGLSIAQKIVEMHNGSIEVKSTVGKGSVFTILLPSSH